MTCPTCFTTIGKHSEGQAQACYAVYQRRVAQMHLSEYAAVLELEQRRPSPSWFA